MWWTKKSHGNIEGLVSSLISDLRSDIMICNGEEVPATVAEALSRGDREMKYGDRSLFIAMQALTEATRLMWFCYGISIKRARELSYECGKLSAKLAIAEYKMAQVQSMLSNDCDKGCDNVEAKN